MSTFNLYSLWICFLPCFGTRQSSGCGESILFLPLTLHMFVCFCVCLCMHVCVHVWLFFFFFFRFYLFFHVRHRERGRGRDTGRGRSRLHALGSRHGTWFQASRITPQAKGSAKSLGHGGCPYVWLLINICTEIDCKSSITKVTLKSLKNINFVHIQVMLIY